VDPISVKVKKRRWPGKWGLGKEKGIDLSLWESGGKGGQI
jgi:hypothetical protein